MTAGDDATFLISFLLIAALLYFAPTLFGFLRGHDKIIGIFILNIVVGWTAIGWILLLAYSLLSNSRSTKT